MSNVLILEGTDIRVVAPLFYNQEPIQFPSSPKLFDVVVIPVKTACGLNSLWHSRFPQIHWSNVVRNKRSVCFAATFQEVYWATAIWSSPIAANRLKNGDQMLELRRMAIADEAPKNTASRMLSVMGKWVHNNFEEITTLISYQDTEAHHGTIYKASNWVAVNQSGKGVLWDNARKRNAAQSDASKVRWELKIR
jgi:hypothetical protein